MIVAIELLIPSMNYTSPGMCTPSKDTRGVEARAKGNDVVQLNCTCTRSIAEYALSTGCPRIEPPVSLPTAMSSQSYAPMPAPGPVNEPLGSW